MWDISFTQPDDEKWIYNGKQPSLHNPYNASKSISTAITLYTALTKIILLSQRMLTMKINTI